MDELTRNVLLVVSVLFIVVGLAWVLLPLRWRVRNFVANLRARFDYHWNKYIFTSGRQEVSWYDKNKVYVWGDVVWDVRNGQRASEFVLRMDGSGTWAVPTETVVVREAYPAPHPTVMDRPTERRLKKGTKVDHPFQARELIIQEEDGVVKGRPWLPRRFRKGQWREDA